jgi:GxxExxY protein
VVLGRKREECLTRRREEREGKFVADCADVCVTFRGGRKLNIEELAAIVVDKAFHLHVDLGPGLLESVYEAVLAQVLVAQGLQVERQKTITFQYQGFHFDDGLRVDLLINNMLVVELKSVEVIAPVHGKQLLTYLRLLKLPLGLLINFGAPTFKQGIKRVVNNHDESEASWVRVRSGNQQKSLRE